MGKAATHAVAFARLITDGKDHGVNGNDQVYIVWNFYREVNGLLI